MPIVTQLAGFLLLIAAVGSFLTAGRSEITALIPALFGLPILLAGMQAERKEEQRRHFIHAALLIALLGLAATLPTALGLGAMGDASDLARIEAWLTVMVCTLYLAFGVRSFVIARRS